MAEAVQRVIDIIDGLALAVSFAGEISHGIVNVRLIGIHGGEGGLGNAAELVISERRGMAGSIGDAQQIIFRVVGVAGHVQRGVVTLVRRSASS